MRPGTLRSAANAPQIVATPEPARSFVGTRPIGRQSVPRAVNVCVETSRSVIGSRARLRQQQPDHGQAAGGNAREPAKSGDAAEMIEGIAGERGAERGADPDRAADDAEPKVEPSA